MPVHVIGTIKPKNNGKFPVVEAIDISGLSYVTPQTYGAVGDGIADDTQAIQQALNQGGIIFFPRGTYKVSGTINVSTAVEIIGEGSETSIISGELNDFIFSFGTTPKRWYPSFYKVSRIGVTNTGTGGTIKFDNATQSELSNCKLSAPQYTDQDNLLLTNESHWIKIENNFIHGGNGITVNASCNGVNIINNYVTYCNNAINLKGGGQHNVLHNDVEGYNKYPYIINCHHSEIECYGERNRQGTWINVTGSSNKIKVIMYSDGGSFYKPLIQLEGNNNDIIIDSTIGYTIFEGDITGKYNDIKVYSCRTLTNRGLMKNPIMYPDNAFSFGREQELLLSEYDDITQFITNDSSDYTYDPATRLIVLQTNQQLYFDFSSILPVDTQGYLYIETLGVSGAEHGHFSYFPLPNSGAIRMDGYIFSFSNYNNNYNRIIFSELGEATQAFKIKKLRLSKYLTNKLISEIEPPQTNNN